MLRDETVQEPLSRSVEVAPVGAWSGDHVEHDVAVGHRRLGRDLDDRERPWRRAHGEHVTHGRDGRPEPREGVRRPRPEHRWDGDAAAHREPRAQPHSRRPEGEHLTVGEDHGRGVGDGTAVDVRRARRAGQRDEQVPMGTDRQASERDLERGGRRGADGWVVDVEQVPHEAQTEQVCRGVGRAGTPHSHAGQARTAGVLDEGERTGGKDLEATDTCPVGRPARTSGRARPRDGCGVGDAGASGTTGPLDGAGASTATKRTDRPGASSDGGSRSTSHSTASVVPSSCQPPGDACG